MAYSLAAAAAATGLNKTAVLRAIKTGKISGTRSQNGEWHVEPAELHRVYPSVPRQRPLRMRLSSIDTEIRTRPSSAELGIWELREKWQQQAERLTPDPVVDHRARPWWRRIVDYLPIRRPKTRPIATRCERSALLRPVLD
jgi:hypothetical protein